MPWRLASYRLCVRPAAADSEKSPRTPMTTATSAAMTTATSTLVRTPRSPHQVARRAPDSTGAEPGVVESDMGLLLVLAWTAIGVVEPRGRCPAPRGRARHSDSIGGQSVATPTKRWAQRACALCDRYATHCS